MAVSLSKQMFLAGSCLQINFIFGGYYVCSKGHGVCFLWSSECAPVCLIPTWAPVLVKQGPYFRSRSPSAPFSLPPIFTVIHKNFFWILKVYSFDLFIWYIYMYECMHIWVFSLCVCLYITCTLVPMEGRKRCLITHRWLWVAMHVDIRNITQVLLKSSHWSYLVNHLSRPRNNVSWTQLSVLSVLSLSGGGQCQYLQRHPGSAGQHSVNMHPGWMKKMNVPGSGGTCL